MVLILSAIGLFAFCGLLCWAVNVLGSVQEANRHDLEIENDQDWIM